MARIIQCVPNFSEGRDMEKVESIVSVIRNKEGIKLLDCSSHSGHNRTVVTFLGSPEKVEEAVIELAEKIYKNIDMSKHKGSYPRMGALDVVPFIPISEVSMSECVELSKKVGRKLAEKFNIPVYLYEESASDIERKDLLQIRKGQYEGFFQKIKDKNWKPDYGPEEVSLSGGCCAVGARASLVEFSVNLATSSIEIADKIAKNVTYNGGGLRYVKAVGVKAEEKDSVEISMNLANFERTSIYRAFEMIKIEARRYGVSVIGSRIIGIIPAAALIQTAEYYLQLEDFSTDQIMENRIL